MHLTPQDAQRLAGVLLEEDPGDAAFSGSPLPPGPFSRYRITRLVGIGGMGEVYEAQQDNPDRRVAIKVIRPDHLSPDLFRRFEHETRILARLQHPGIVPIYEAGQAPTSSGPMPFFAMEFVDGRPLTAHATDSNLSIKARLELFLSVCDAVEHAHRKGIIHRDLKPANILIDGRGQPRILDFGIARATDSDIRTTTLHTEIGRLIGTLPYMSPEQAGGDPDELDTRSDVYSLGIILYELLSGRAPFDFSIPGQRLIPQALRAILETEPAPLSSISRVFRGDLETIVGKALAKEKERRYQSVTELAADVRRHLNNEPVVARPPSLWYQTSRLAARNRTATVSLCAAGALLLGSTIIATTSAARERAARHDAETAATEASGATAAAIAGQRAADHQRAIATAVSTFLTNLLGAASSERLGRDAKIVDALSDLAGAQRSIDDQPEPSAAVALTIGRVYLDLGDAKSAVEQFQSALGTLRNASLDQTPTAAEIMVALAEAEFSLGAYGESEQIAKAALALANAVEGGESLDSLGARNMIAQVRKWSGHPDEAATIWEETWRIGQRTQGPDNPFTLTYQNGYADALLSLNRYAECEPIFRDLLARRERLLGVDHPRTLIARENLANVFLWTRRFDEAQVAYEQVLSARRRIFGDNHPKTLTTLNNLAILAGERGDNQACAALLREVIDRTAAVKGRHHPDTLIAISSLVYTLAELGQLDEGYALASEVYQARTETDGSESPQAIVALNSICKILLLQDALDRAEPLLSRLLEQSRRALPPDDWRIAVIESNYGSCLRRLSRFDQAEPLLLHSRERLAKEFGPSHERSAKVVTELIALYTAWGKPDDAAKYRALLPRDQQPPK